MHHPERSHIPGWAERERAADLAWVGENLQEFWPVARAGYKEVGRGAVVVDITSRPTGEGHPFGYFAQETLEEIGDDDTQRMVRDYDSSWEMVTVLLKTHGRSSTYRVGVVSPDPSERRR